MQYDVLKSDGTATSTIELNDAVFSSKVSEGSLYNLMRNQLANTRQGTAATKARNAVQYSNRKPWRQKGTGRARAGSRRSPIWVGGGTIFGPQPRDYSYTLPKKIRALAYRSLFSQWVKDGVLKVIELEEPKSEKTKDFYAQILPFNAERKAAVLIIQDDNALLKRVACNIPWLRVFTYDKLNLRELYYRRAVLVTREAAEKLNQFLDRKT